MSKVLSRIYCPHDGLSVVKGLRSVRQSLCLNSIARKEAIRCELEGFTEGTYRLESSVPAQRSAFCIHISYRTSYKIFSESKSKLYEIA